MHYFQLFAQVNQGQELKTVLNQYYYYLNKYIIERFLIFNAYYILVNTD